jgi:hypothetical protein
MNFVINGFAVAGVLYAFFLVVAIDGFAMLAAIPTSQEPRTK